MVLHKNKKWSYPVESITDADKIYDAAIIVNTPTQDVSLLNCMEKATGIIDLYENANKTVMLEKQ